MTSSTSSTGHRWRNLTTGVLFVVGLALLSSLALIVGKNTSLFEQHHTLRLFITDIKGLGEGNPVSISGKKIGTVEQMELTRRDDTSGVLVTLRIKEEYFPLITHDSRATIKSIGVLGDKYVDIALGRSSTTLDDGQYLSVGSDPGIDDLTATALKTVNSLGKVSDEVLALTERINQGEGSLGQLVSSNELSDRITGTITNLQAVTGKLSSGDGLMGKFLNDHAMAQRFSSVITSLSALSDSLAQGRGTIGKLFMDERLYTSLSTIADRTDTLITRLEQRSSALDNYSKDSEIYTNLNKSIASLDSLFTDVRKHPKRYLNFTIFE